MSSHRFSRLAGIALLASIAGTVGAGAVGAATTTAEGDPSLNPMASYPKADLKAFVNAPLFDPARRLPPVLPPPPAPMQPVRVSVKQPPSLQLVGVVQGTRAEAIIQRNGQIRVVHTGDDLDGWFVEVLPVSLRLHSGLRAYDYAMFQANGQEGPAAVGMNATMEAARQPPPRTLRPGE